MGASGTTTIDFGAFPGNSDTSIAVTGQAGIVAGSLVEAWILPAATADHTADEHIVDPPMITAGNIVAGTGFTIYATARDGIPVPDRSQSLTAGVVSGSSKIPTLVGDAAPRPYGVWNIAWVWN